MKKEIHRAEDRGHANHGWLNAHHSFSFASYYNPDKMHFGLLRVLNDDIVAPGTGFGMHPHENMEIVTIPLRGALQHKDSEGNTGTIKSGDVQIMSAGSGIYHSEMNASNTEEINLLQTWIFPKVNNIKPRYQQITFDVSERLNHFQTVVSPDKNETTLWINQDAWYSLTRLEAGKDTEYKMHKTGNGAYVFLIEGAIEIDGVKLGRRDALGISESHQFAIQSQDNSEILVIEVPMA